MLDRSHAAVQLIYAKDQRSPMAEASDDSGFERMAYIKHMLHKATCLCSD